MTRNNTKKNDNPGGWRRRFSGPLTLPAVTLVIYCLYAWSKKDSLWMFPVTQFDYNVMGTGPYTSIFLLWLFAFIYIGPIYLLVRFLIGSGNLGDLITIALLSWYLVTKL